MDNINKYNQKKLGEIEEVVKSNIPNKLKEILLIAEIFSMKTTENKTIKDDLIEKSK